MHNKTVLSVQARKSRPEIKLILCDFNEMQQMRHLKLCFGIFKSITPRLSTNKSNEK